MFQMDFTALARFEPYLRSLARIIFAFIFFQYGTQKLFGWFGGFGGPGNTAPLNSALGYAGVIETITSTLIFFGLFTRPLAFLVSGQMAVAYFRTHAPNGFFPLPNGGAPAVMFCFFWLWLAAAGAGPWSIDHLLGRKTSNWKTGN